MKIKFEEHNFKPKTLELINKVNALLDEYHGMQLTLRQMFYRLVARGHIENTAKNYKNLGNVINDGRMAGLIDWSAFEDRTRNARGGDDVYSPPARRIKSCAEYFSIGRWFNQPNYLEVWVEKDAQIDIVGRACSDTDTVRFSCRGFCSATAMFDAAQRFKCEKERGRDCYLFYLGDHDPSGLDMPRDIIKRLETFGAVVDFRRIALTQEQIQKFNPPPCYTKITDPRAKDYLAKFGDNSWELDALEPNFIQDLIRAEIDPLIDKEILADTLALEEEQRRELQLVADNYEEIIDQLKGA